MNSTKQENIEIEGMAFIIKTYMEARSTVAASIRNNVISIRLPSGLKPDEIVHAETRLRAWAVKKITRNPEKFKSEPVKRYRHNSKLKIGDKEYKLNLSEIPGRYCKGYLKNEVISIGISRRLSTENKHRIISKMLNRLIGRERLPLLRKRVNELNSLYFNRPINKISFKNQRTCWGSCSKKGNINISTRLINAPDSILDYICIHELAHLVEMNHSGRFWELVAKAMPGYREKEKWLKENSKTVAF